jgi:hypothetical protein
MTLTTSNFGGSIMKKGTMLSNVITKTAQTSTTTITAAGSSMVPIVSLGTAFVVGVTKPYSAAKVVFPFIKAGGGGAVSVQIELQSDTGAASAYQSLTNTDGVTITPIGTDAEHGYVATTGNGVVEANFDLGQVKCGTNLKINISASFIAVNTDTVIGLPLIQFAGARRDPPTGTVVNTIA